MATTIMNMNVLPRRRLTGMERFNDIIGEPVPNPKFAPWTYPDQMIEGTLNGFNVKPHVPQIVQGSDGVWRTLQGIEVKKPSENALNKPIIPNNVVALTSNDLQGIPMPAPLSSEPPPRSRNLNQMDADLEAKVEGLEEKIGETMMSDNPVMSADEYRIHVSAKDGDCLFDSIRQALTSINKPVTIEQLRVEVAKMVYAGTETTENTILTWHTFYNEAKKAGDEEMMQEYNHISCVADDDLPLSKEARDKLYASMMTKAYWAEEFAISVLEKSLNVKLLILDGDRKTAMMGTDHGPLFNPKYYLILVLQKQHYMPVSSKGIFCFKKHQIPRDVVEKFQKDCGRSMNHYQSLKDEIHNPMQIKPLPVL